MTDVGGIGAFEHVLGHALDQRILNVMAKEA
jgi:hypothetical protein